MSREQEYFPPQGTEFKWGSKPLNYSPWHCDIGSQMEPALSLWPMRVTALVDLRDGSYVWRVAVTDFAYKRSYLHGSDRDALAACLEAERAGKTKLQELLPSWVREALANKWRPPC